MKIKPLILAVLGILLGYAGVEALEPTFANFVALSLATVTVTNFLDDLLKIQKLLAVIVSWVVGIALTVTGWLLQLGFLVDLVFWQAIVTGVGVSVVANLMWDPAMIKKLLEHIGALPEGKKV